MLTDDEIGILLTAAGHAPSMHNTQPWRFEVQGPVIDVLLDEDRMLPAEDVSGRAAHIGVGAAVFNVQVAAAVLGRQSHLAVHPDPARPDVAARVFLADRDGPVTRLVSLYAEVPQRHTYRGPLLDRPIDRSVRRELDAAARTEGAELHWLSAPDDLAALLRQADAEELRDDDRRHERAAWIGGDRQADGVPENALGPIPTRQAFVRDLAAGFDSGRRSQAVYEADPDIAVLTTRDEDETGWVRAGVALQHVLLVATAHGLATSFLDQLLEHPAPRAQLRNRIGDRIGELRGDRPWPQMVIRIGYPAQTMQSGQSGQSRQSGQSAQSARHTGRRDWHLSSDRWFQTGEDR